jgi:hypothetical protein
MSATTLSYEVTKSTDEATVISAYAGECAISIELGRSHGYAAWDLAEEKGVSEFLDATVEALIEAKDDGFAPTRPYQGVVLTKDAHPDGEYEHNVSSYERISQAFLERRGLRMHQIDLLSIVSELGSWTYIEEGLFTVTNSNRGANIAFNSDPRSIRAASKIMSELIQVEPKLDPDELAEVLREGFNVGRLFRRGTEALNSIDNEVLREELLKTVSIATVDAIMQARETRQSQPAQS